MADLSNDKRAELAAELIQQAPPGEVNDVINGIRAIIADDDALMPHAGIALRAYNLSNLTVVEHAAKEGIAAHTSMLSEASLLPGSESDSESGAGAGERYIDPTGKQSFAFDHLTMTTSEYEPYELPQEEETFRAELAKSLAAYTKNHYATGQSAVQCSQYPLLPPEPEAPEAPEEAVPAEQTKDETASVSASTEKVAPSSEPTTEQPKSLIEPTSSNAKQGYTPVVEEGTATSPEETAKEVQTDIIAEQLGGGAEEPAPTPGGAEVLEGPEASAPAPLLSPEGAGEKGAGTEAQKEVVEGEEELAKVDEGVQVAKGEEVERGDTPVVTEEAQGEGKAVEGEAKEEGVPKEEEEVSPLVKAPKREQKRTENPIYTLEIVGNKHKTEAFWTGRWRTRWTVDKAGGKVLGKIQVDVHYFEQGNVQLTTSHSASFDYPSSPQSDSQEAQTSQKEASQIVTTIARLETEYQLELQDVYGDLGEKAFRSLRRALPVTRQKIDWDKVGGYSLGSDIGKAAA